MSTCSAVVIDNSIHSERDELLESVQLHLRYKHIRMAYYEPFPHKNPLTRSWTRMDRIKCRTTRLIKMGTTRMIGTNGPDSKGKLDPTVIGDLEPCTMEA